jgi:hypothetical protein
MPGCVAVAGLGIAGAASALFIGAFFMRWFLAALQNRRAPRAASGGAAAADNADNAGNGSAADVPPAVGGRPKPVVVVVEPDDSVAVGWVVSSMAAADAGPAGPAAEDPGKGPGSPPPADGIAC